MRSEFRPIYLRDLDDTLIDYSQVYEVLATFITLDTPLDEAKDLATTITLCMYKREPSRIDLMPLLRLYRAHPELRVDFISEDVSDCGAAQQLE
jgi:hypothetical protein